jgi:hypothetical protein
MIGERGPIMPKNIKKDPATAKKPGPGLENNPAAAAKVAAAPAGKVPTAKQLADYMGVPLKTPLKANETWALLKPLPGYRAVMDNVAENLREDNHLLELSYDPDEILRRLGKAKQLSNRNAVLQEVLAGSDGERQVEDGWLMKVLLDSVKRVNEEARTHPEVKQRWTEILDFVKKNRPGRSAGSGGSGGRNPPGGGGGAAPDEKP